MGPDRHRKTLKLAWAAGEGFEVEGDRDLAAEVEAFLAEHAWVTVKEICTSREAARPGIGANETAVKDLLEGSRSDSSAELATMRRRSVGIRRRFCGGALGL